MLAGMWGAKLNNGTRDRYKEMLHELLKNVVKGILAKFLFYLCITKAEGKEWKWTGSSTLDQHLLSKIVWPQVSHF